MERDERPIAHYRPHPPMRLNPSTADPEAVAVAVAATMRANGMASDAGPNFWLTDHEKVPHKHEGPTPGQ